MLIKNIGGPIFNKEYSKYELKKFLRKELTN